MSKQRKTEKAEKPSTLETVLVIAYMDRVPAFYLKHLNEKAAEKILKSYIESVDREGIDYNIRKTIEQLYPSLKKVYKAKKDKEAPIPLDFSKGPYEVFDLDALVDLNEFDLEYDGENLRTKRYSLARLRKAYIN